MAARENLEAVTKGVKQAVGYRHAHKCRLAALSCYDMRKPPDPEAAIAHEVSNAATWNVGCGLGRCTQRPTVPGCLGELALLAKDHRALIELLFATLLSRRSH